MSTTADEPTRAPSAPRDRVVLDGTGLDVGGVVRLADNDAVPVLAPEALERVWHSWRTAERLAATGRLYGRGTGVGAHRQVVVDEDDQAAHGLRLLRSHAGGAGALLPARQARAMLAVRANQLLAGGSGIHPAFVEGLAEALRLGVHPAVHEYGGVGTGDLTALAETGLTLLGERPWLGATASGTAVAGPAGGAAAPAGDAAFPAGADDPAVPAGGPVGPAGGPSVPVPRSPGDDLPRLAPPRAGAVPPCPDGAPPMPSYPGGTQPVPVPPQRGGALPAPVPLRPGDALALLSSNALALGQAALACHDLSVLLRAAHAVAALSLTAVSGSPEAYAAPVHAVRPYPGPARAAAEVRRLLGLPGRPPQGTGRRIQDPYGFRAFPQAHGAALEAADRLRHVVETEVNCPTENPLIGRDGTAHHHGGFFAAPLGLALDGLDLALLGTAQLSAARLAALGRTDLTGLPAFLAPGPAGSSGTMILEYTAHSALAELRTCAAPASAGHAVLSHGLEEAASFASQAARQALRAVAAYRTVLACELVVAVRALRLGPVPPDHLPAFTAAAGVLPPGTEDRPLTADVTAAAELLPRLAEL